MSRKGENADIDRVLRRHAEKELKAEAKGSDDLLERDPLALIHELQVHQIELEMQNEELRRAHAEAEELRERYQDLYDFAPVGYLTLDADGVIREANLTAASLMKTARGHLCKCRFSQFVAPSSQQIFSDFLRRTQLADSRQSCEVELGRRKESPVHLLVEGIAMTMAKGGGRHVRLALMDIADRKRFEQKLLEAREAAEAASRAKSRFLANMSHELRTPMTGIIGLIDFTLGEELSPSLRCNLETALDSARSLMRILNDVLDMTMIEAGGLLLEAKSFDLRECVGSVISLLAPEAKNKGIGLVLTMATDLPPLVCGDGVRLRQVLTNLIGNAVKFTEQGKVGVQVTSGGTLADGRADISFAVSDTGIGIAADQHHLLFHSFSQTDSTNVRKYGGSGLGLAISRELVERMGGSISFASEAGQGSTFSFRIPLGIPSAELAADAAAHATVADPAPSPGAKPHLLVAEDDATIMKVLKLILTLRGFDAEFVSDGVEVVNRWEAGHYDLILMDIQMPRRDGYAATRMIRDKERERGGHIPIIAMTAHAFKEDESRCLDAGMDDYFSKPIDINLCVSKIWEAIGKEAPAS